MEQSVATGCLSVPGEGLHSVRAGSAHSRAPQCCFNFKHVGDPGKVRGITDFQN